MAKPSTVEVKLDASAMPEAVENLTDDLLDRLAAKVAARLPKPVEAVLKEREPSDEELRQLAARLADHLYPLIAGRPHHDTGKIR
jgi:hypothetical protein